LPSNSATHPVSLDACGEYERAANPTRIRAMADRRFMMIFSQALFLARVL
jgi:hypothetical protein